MTGLLRRPDVLTGPGHLADLETGARLAHRTRGHFGRVDTLVDNPAVFVAKPFTGDAIAFLQTAEFVADEILHVDRGQSAGH